MRIFVSLAAVSVLVLISYLGAGPGGLHSVFGVMIPFIALVVFIAGVVYRVIRWAMVPVPYHIPTTCGQQKSLPWIKNSYLESPHTTLGVIGRMALEVLLFRSLFRNTKMELYDRKKLIYWGDKWLWAAGLAFHWSFLFILIRHSRFFVEPVPFFIPWMSAMDGFFEVTWPTIYATDAAILLGLTFLFMRRVIISQVRYISLPSDYFPLFLLLGIAGSGMLMRHIYKVDLLSVKELALGLFSFHPVVPEGIGAIFYVHLFLVSVLLMYFPWSKLMHMGGVFLSPTRNLANNSRMVRHVNPMNPQVKVHTYDEWEEEFKDYIQQAGLPLEKE